MLASTHHVTADSACPSAATPFRPEPPGWPRTLAVAASLVVVAVAPLLSSCAHTPHTAGQSSVSTEVRAVLDRQVADWNAGSIPDFMGGYARSEATRFASGGEVTRGWETVLARYTNRYTNRAAMGHLSFAEVEITPLSKDAALVFGRWHLVRDKDEPSGLFTLIFRKTTEGWRIVHDHTSSAAP